MRKTGYFAGNQSQTDFKPMKKEGRSRSRAKDDMVVLKPKQANFMGIGVASHISLNPVLSHKALYPVNSNCVLTENNALGASTHETTLNKTDLQAVHRIGVKDYKREQLQQQ